MCKLTLSGNEYVVYSIDRDQETDNIFISKLVSNHREEMMVDISDEEEKKRLDNVVKELILLAKKVEDN